MSKKYNEQFLNFNFDFDKRNKNLILSSFTKIRACFKVNFIKNLPGFYTITAFINNEFFFL